MPSAATGSPIDRLKQQIATLKVTIEALLRCERPNSPIVKEKLDQMEKLVVSIPLELELANYWQDKMSKWWVEFAIQQAAATSNDPPATVCEPKAKPCHPVVDKYQGLSALEISKIVSMSSKAVSEELKTVPPAGPNARLETAIDFELTKEQIPENFRWQSTATPPAFASVSKERQSGVKHSRLAAPLEAASSTSSHARPANAAAATSSHARPVNTAPAPSNSNERFSSSVPKQRETAPPTTTNWGGHRAPAPTVPESEPIFEPVPDDFDWGSAPQ